MTGHHPVSGPAARRRSDRCDASSRPAPVAPFFPARARRRALKLTYGGARYLDRTEALWSGEAVPDGIELECVADHPREVFHRMIHESTYHTSEMSMAHLIGLANRGDDRFIAIPVFPLRLMRHRDMYVVDDSPFEQPSQLAGARVGVPMYHMTAITWSRAILQEEYDVAPRQVRWTYGRLESPLESPPLLIGRLPTDTRIEPLHEQRTLIEALLAGHLDALLTQITPRAYRDGRGRLRRLVVDYRAVEREYAQRTGYYPIIHTVVMRRDIYRQHPWAARSLYDAFVASREVARSRRGQHGGGLAHPWWEDESRELDELFGGDPYRNGFAANRRTLEAICRYSLEHGNGTRLIAPEDLFVPELVE